MSVGHKTKPKNRNTVDKSIIHLDDQTVWQLAIQCLEQADGKTTANAKILYTLMLGIHNRMFIMQDVVCFYLFLVPYYPTPPISHTPQDPHSTF